MAFNGINRTYATWYNTHMDDNHNNDTDNSQNETLKLLVVAQSRKRDNPEQRRGGDVILRSVPEQNNHLADTSDVLTTTASTESFMDLLLNPNFEELSRQFPYFRNVYQKKKKNLLSSRKYNNQITSTLFTPEFTMVLSRALLHLHFGLSLSFQEQLEPNKSQTNEGNNIEIISCLPHTESPSFRFLCPPIPNRFYYVQWIVHTLLPLRTNPLYFEYNGDESTTHSRNQYIYGLDIGTGATCIYPLLFSYFNKSSPTGNQIIVMHGTDIDIQAIEVAQTNINMNYLQSYIHLHFVQKSHRQQHQTQPPQCMDASSCNNDAMTIDDVHDENDSNDYTKLERPQQSQEYPSQQHLGGGPLIQSLQCIINKQHEQASSFTLPQPFDFVMTNPPFYDTIHTSNEEEEEEDINADYNVDSNRTEKTEIINKQLRQRKQNIKRRTTLMTTNEGFYPEGEIGFGLDLIVDSWNLFVLQHQHHHSMHNSEPELPHWVSMMCGKKSTYTYLHHILYQLLGPAHICTTQFGPGDHTRWFLAWSYHRPVVRSPLALMSKNCWTFAVAVSLDPPPPPEMDLHQSPVPYDTAKLQCQEVVDRFQQYCRTFRTSDVGDKHDLMCEDTTVPNNNMSQYRRSGRMDGLHVFTKLQLHERENDSSMASSWVDDELLPKCLQQVLNHTDPSIRGKNLLPCSCEHYLLDVTLRVNNETARKYRKPNIQNEVQVQINGFCHSPYGQRMIDKIKSQLQHEICRTSRRWRRIMKQDEQEKVKEASMDESMD